MSYIITQDHSWDWGCQDEEWTMSDEEEEAKPMATRGKACLPRRNRNPKRKCDSLPGAPMETDDDEEWVPSVPMETDDAIALLGTDDDPMPWIITVPSKTGAPRYRPTTSQMIIALDQAVAFIRNSNPKHTAIEHTRWHWMPRIGCYTPMFRTIRRSGKTMDYYHRSGTSMTNSAGDTISTTYETSAASRSIFDVDVVPRTIYLD